MTNIDTVNTICDFLDEMQPREDHKEFDASISFFEFENF